MKYEAGLATVEGLWDEGIGLRTGRRYEIGLLGSRKQAGRIARLY